MAHTRAVLAATLQDGVRRKTLHAAQPRNSHPFFVPLCRVFGPLLRLFVPLCRGFGPLRRLTRRADAAPQLFTITTCTQGTAHHTPQMTRARLPLRPAIAGLCGLAWHGAMRLLWPIAGGVAGRAAPHSGHPRAPTVAPHTYRDSPAATVHGLPGGRLPRPHRRRDRLATSAPGPGSPPLRSSKPSGAAFCSAALFAFFRAAYTSAVRTPAVRPVAVYRGLSGITAPAPGRPHAVGRLREEWGWRCWRRPGRHSLWGRAHIRTPTDP
jgi:hypothetical protein